VIALSSRVPGRASRPSRSRVDDGGGLQYVSRKIDRVFRFFPSRGIYRRKDGVRRWTRRPHPLVVWARARLRCPRVCPAFGPPSSHLWTSRRFGKKIGGSAFVSSNSENISCVAFLKHKNSKKTGNWHCGVSLVG
jgi:hypothetical protein